MSQLKIRNALETNLAAFATTKSLPVVWENVAAIPSGSYLKATMFPAETVDPSIGASHKRYVGIFRITYYHNGLNTGMKAVETIVDDIVAYFPRGLELVKDGYSIRIERTPSSSSVGIESNYVYVSVSMYYRCDVIL